MIKAAKLRYSVSLLALALASGFPASSPVVAADLPVKAVRPVTPEVISWEGFYWGGHLGWGRAKHSGSFRDPDSIVFADALNLKGLLGGLHAGYNWDRGALVWGIEGDWSFMRWKRTAFGISSETLLGEINQLGSIRARIGIPLGPDRRGLGYLTGGAALSDAKVTAFDGPQGSPFTESQTLKFRRLGGVVGAGLEWAATNQVRVRAETLYYIFDNKKPITLGEAEPGDAVKLKNIWTARLGLTWYFSSAP